MKYIDLFAGIGGFRYGLERANWEQKPDEKSLLSNRNKPNNKRSTRNKRKQNTYTCVYSNEWDKYASQIYKKHYGEIDTTDITKVKAKDIPDHDLLCAGFPCQSFSIAGKRKGFEDTRGTLFFEIARIAKYKRPRYLLLENVKGLLSHDKGKTFQTILGVLSDMGYRVEWQILNSKHFGVPQNRERVFIIGHLGKESGRKIFPIGGEDRKNVQQGGKKPESRSWVSTLDSRYGERWSTETYVRENKIIAWSKSKGTHKGKTRDEQRIKTNEFNTLSTGSGGSSASSQNFVGENTRIRRLTPTECERLQGFPDGWTEGLSDTQRYKCLGNAVTTNVISSIGEKLL